MGVNPIMIKNDNFILDMFYTPELDSVDAQKLVLFNDADVLWFYEQVEFNGTIMYRVPRYYFTDKEATDLTTHGEDIDLKIKPNYAPQSEAQRLAIEAIVNNDHGLVAAKVGFGKTYVAIDAISRIKKKALIVVNKTALIDQWIERIVQFTSLTADDIGIISGRKQEFNKPICIATVQTLFRRVKNEDKAFIKSMYEANFGVTFYDECHITAAAPTFSTSVKTVFSKRLYGLSATPYRSDGLGQLLSWFIGPIIFDDSKLNVPVYVGLVDIPLYISQGYKKYIEWSNDNSIITRYCKFLKKQDVYIRQIAKTIDDLIKLDLQILGLSAMIDLLYMIYDKCQYKHKISIVHSSVEEKDYSKQCILATYGMFKEGMDVPRLNTLIYITPITNKNSLMQSIGRISRYTSADKKAFVIDIVNSEYEPLKKMREYRLRYYKQFGFKYVNADLDNIDKFIEYARGGII